MNQAIGQAVPGVWEDILQPIYDTVTIPAAGTNLLTFFALPLGQGQSSFGAAGVTKTYADTNLNLASQLPAGFSLQVLGLRMQFPWLVTMADVQSAFNGAVLEFEVGAKVFLRIPAQCIPAGNGPAGIAFQAAAATDALINNGWPDVRNALGMSRKPLLLSPTSNFSVRISWPSGLGSGAVTTAIVGAAVAGLPVRLYIDGIQKRPAQ